MKEMHSRDVTMLTVLVAVVYIGLALLQLVLVLFIINPALVENF